MLKKFEVPFIYEAMLRVGGSIALLRWLEILYGHLFLRQPVVIFGIVFSLFIVYWALIPILNVAVIGFKKIYEMFLCSENQIKVSFGIVLLLCWIFIWIAMFMGWFD